MTVLEVSSEYTSTINPPNGQKYFFHFFHVYLSISISIFIAFRFRFCCSSSVPVFCFQGLGTDDRVLVEIMCSRTNAEIAAIKEAYKKG